MNSDGADTQPSADPAAEPSVASSQRRRMPLIGFALLAAIGAGAWLYWRVQQQPVPGFEPLPEPEHALIAEAPDDLPPADERALHPPSGSATPPASEATAETPVDDAPLPLPAPAEEPPVAAPLQSIPTLQPELAAVLQARITELEAAVAALATRPAPATSGRRLVLDEVAGLAALAEQRLHLARDVAGAVSALRLAATRLTGADFMSLRDALADDLAALGAFRDVDTAALAAELATLARQAPGFALAGLRPLAAEEPAAPATGWRGVLAAVWQSLSELVEVRDSAEAADPLLNPAHAALARQQLALDLSAARVALLLRDAGGLRAALDPAIGQLEQHFDGADPAVRTALARLREIAGLDIAPALPSLARSVDAVGLAQREEKAL
jgi:uncharacterized protein HemX